MTKQNWLCIAVSFSENIEKVLTAVWKGVVLYIMVMLDFHNRCIGFHFHTPIKREQADLKGYYKTYKLEKKTFQH